MVKTFTLQIMRGHMQIDMSVPDDFCQGYDPERLSLPEDIEVDFPPEDKVKIKFKPFKVQRD